MTNIFKISIVLAAFLFIARSSHSQTKIDTVKLIKGEVFDILLISQNDESQAALKSYFQTVLPVGVKYSYQPIPGFRIKDHTQGNIRPESLILGKWESVKAREKFLNEIENEVPDFHERRREIWSFFGLKYFEVKENTSFVINRGRYHVATAYWYTDSNRTGEFHKDWLKAVRKEGGQVLITLTGGVSPFGYQYDPDFFVITSWENESSFKAFRDRRGNDQLNAIQHVNEFILE